ncbi:MAG: DEAD/DEAH box helicase, partial [Myxococcales bacterium]|nr:DEAD/DEAH box helicase [Myxococcales bacterium]
WNPAVENQATDRAYRIGQHKNVLVHKFVCRGTLEERIDAMLRDKQGLADGVLADEGEHRLTELSTDELLRVVSLDLRAALADD